MTGRCSGGPQAQSFRRVAKTMQMGTHYSAPMGPRTRVVLPRQLIRHLQSGFVISTGYRKLPLKLQVMNRVAWALKLPRNSVDIQFE